jgi:hypothetical protein
MLDKSQTEANNLQKKFDAALIVFNEQKNEMTTLHKENLQKLQEQLKDRYIKQELPRIDTTEQLQDRYITQSFETASAVPSSPSSSTVYERLM